jgi:6-phosphogluconolactonase/glucosamine-6-phosphate isomerase/deaminase
MPLINNARRIIFLVEGLHKATILRKVVEERDQALPATRVKAINGDLFFLVDADAAGQLARNTYVTGAL